MLNSTRTDKKQALLIARYILSLKLNTSAVKNNRQFSELVKYEERDLSEER